MGRTVSSLWRALFVALSGIVLAGALVAPAAAWAATFTSKAPAAGSSTLATKPSVSVSVYDRDGVRASSISMSFDGKVVKPTVSYTRRGDLSRFKVKFTPSAPLMPGLYKVSVKTKNRRGRSSVVTWAFTVLAPPVTTSDVLPSYEGTVTIRLFASIAARSTAGVAHTYYQLDGAPPVEGTSVVVLAPAWAEGTAVHALTYWSVSSAGVVEKPNSVTFADVALPDTTAPDTAVYGAGDSVGDHSYVGTVTVFLSPEDRGGSGLSHTYLQVDGGTAVEATKVVVAPPAVGSVSHVVAYWSVDAAGNVESTRYFDFEVAAEPVYSAIYTTSNLRSGYAATATIVLTPHDGGLGVGGTYYRLDGGETHEGTRVVVPAPVVESANHTIEFWSVDGAGNEESHHTGSFYVEANQIMTTGGPNPLTVTSDALSSYNETATITLTGSPATTRIYWRLDGGQVVEGTQVIVAPPAVGTESHTLEVWPTESSPGVGEKLTVHFSVSGVPAADEIAPTTISDAQQMYTGPATIRLSAVDDPGGSGVAATYWRLDGGAWHTGDVPVVTKAGLHTLEFYSVDNAGNTEVHHSIVFAVADTTPPVSLVDAQQSYVGTAVIIITPGDGDGSGVAATYYQLDGGPTQSGTTVVVPSPAGGTAMHTLVYWSVDNAGNAEAPNAVTFAVSPIDRNPPVTRSDALTIYAGTATIHLTATDGAHGSGVAATYWRLDGGAWQTGAIPPVTAPGHHLLEFYSVDNAGNVETTKAFTFTIDTTPPVSLVDAQQSYVGTAVIIITPGDGDGSGVAATYFKLDGGPTQTGTTVVVPPPVRGTAMHSLVYWSVDNAGNAESPATITFSVSELDLIPPVTVCDALTTYAGPATIHLTATDDANGSGVGATFWRLDGGAWQSGAIPPVTAPGHHVLQFYSVDNAGNQETISTVSFLIDTTPPVSLVNAAQSYVGTAVIIITPGDGEGSGVAATYYQLDGGPTQTGNHLFVPAPVSGTAMHSLAYWSVDNAGNFEVTKTVTFSVSRTDILPPVTVSDAVADYSGSATIHLTATDDVHGSGVAATYWRLDGGAWQTGAIPPVVLPGHHLLEFYSVDNAGNVETTHSLMFFLGAS